MSRPVQVRTSLKAAAWLTVVLVAVIIVGNQDKRALEEEQRRYCNNVSQGVWPDYKGTFKKECGGNNPPKFNGNLTK